MNTLKITSNQTARLIILILLISIRDDSSLGIEAIAAVVGAAAGAIQAGVSITSAASAQTVHNVRINIFIENYTKWNFEKVSAINVAGYIPVVPADLLSCRKEQLYAHKSSDKATGTFGMVRFQSNSLDISEENQVNIMWSAPYSFDFYSNYLVIDCTSGQGSNLAEIANDMYYADTYKNLRKEFYSSVEQLEDTCSKFKVVVTMGTSHAPEIHVKLIPLKYEDLADCVRSYYHQKF
jgi:hypothetical protein